MGRGKEKGYKLGENRGEKGKRRGGRKRKKWLERRRNKEGK